MQLAGHVGHKPGEDAEMRMQVAPATEGLTGFMCTLVCVRAFWNGPSGRARWPLRDGPTTNYRLRDKRAIECKSEAIPRAGLCRINTPSSDLRVHSRPPSPHLRPVSPVIPFPLRPLYILE